MLTNVSSADYLITGDSVREKDNVQSIGKTALNALSGYAKETDFSDSLEISDEAKSLLQKEKDVQFFTQMSLDSPISEDETAAIMQLIEKGEFIDNKDLADALNWNQDLMRQLFI